jgi:hypothetical protein
LLRWLHADFDLPKRFGVSFLSCQNFLPELTSSLATPKRAIMSLLEETSRFLKAYARTIPSSGSFHLAPRSRAAEYQGQALG